MTTFEFTVYSSTRMLLYTTLVWEIKGLRDDWKAWGRGYARELLDRHAGDRCVVNGVNDVSGAFTFEVLIPLSAG